LLKTNSKLETIGSEYKKMENENNKLKTSIKSINEQYSTTKKESKERSIEISVLKEKLEKEGQNCEELKSQQISLLEENSSLKSKYKKINEMNRMLQEESKQLNEQIMVLKKTLKNERPNIKIDEYYLLLNQIFATIQNMLPENLKSPIKTFDLSTDIKTYKKYLPQIKRLDSDAFKNMFQGNKEYEYNIQNRYHFNLLLDKFNNFSTLLDEWYEEEDKYDYIRQLWLKYISIESMKNKTESEIQNFLSIIFLLGKNFRKVNEPYSIFCYSFFRYGRS